MAEKKTATKKVATSKEATPKKAVAKKNVLTVNAESAGFRAGDVYQALAAAGKSLNIAEIAKNAKISKEEAYVGIGWLFKEGKIKGEGELFALA